MTELMQHLYSYTLDTRLPGLIDQTYYSHRS